MEKITFKEFLEKSKVSKSLQAIVSQALIAGLNVAKSFENVFPNKPKPDSGKLMLLGIKSICELLDIEITGEDEITAEYMAEILNSYSVTCQP